MPEQHKSNMQSQDLNEMYKLRREPCAITPEQHEKPGEHCEMPEQHKKPCVLMPEQHEKPREHCEMPEQHERP
eukprot:3214783-Ditylum_brightwellii.AAC.1